LQKQAKQILKQEGKDNYTKMRKTTKQLGIPEDRQDEVIARIFLDLNLKRTRGGFKK